MTQWIDCDNRFSGSGKPSRLDFVFTKDMEIIETIHYDSPLGKSDHLLMKFNLKNENVATDEIHKVKFKYSKAEFERLRKFFCCGLERL